MAQPERVRRRSAIGGLAIVAVAVSALGLAVLLIGVVSDIEGAQEGEQGPVIFPIAWFSYLLGGLASLILGAIAFAFGRSRKQSETRRAGLLALGYTVVAVLFFLLAG